MIKTLLKEGLMGGKALSLGGAMWDTVNVIKFNAKGTTSRGPFWLLCVDLT